MQKKKKETICFKLQNKRKIDCEICGNPKNNLDFKGKKICEGEANIVQNAPEVIEAYLGHEYMRRKNMRSQNVAN